MLLAVLTAFLVHSSLQILILMYIDILTVEMPFPCLLTAFDNWNGVSTCSPRNDAVVCVYYICTLDDDA